MSVGAKASLSPFIRGRLLVIGDTIVDIRHQGKPLHASVESRSPVVGHTATHISIGGSGFLVRNMLALGGNVTFVTLVGDDEYAQHAEKWVHKNLKKIVVRASKRNTTVKERFWSREEKVLAWDRVDNAPISKDAQDKIIGYVKKHIASFERLVISDYRHGLLPEPLAHALVGIAKKAGKLVYVDSQVAQHEANHTWYRGADLFCVNVKEAKNIDPKFSEDSLKSSLEHLQKILDTKNLILKRGELGSMSRIGTTLIETPASNITARDATGAGDAFFAVVALSKVLDKNALIRANAWAGLKTKILGTETPSLTDLKKILRSTAL